MMYRCIHCGGSTGETTTEANENYTKEHGVGVCCSPCRYCNEGVKHAPHVCTNVRKGRPYPPFVADFIAYHGHT